MAVAGATVTAPASELQRHWWATDLVFRDSSMVVPSLLRVCGPIDAEALRAALAAVVQRHEALRTSFARLRRDLVQVIHPDVPAGAGWVRDLSGVPAAERDAALRELVAAELRRGFDLGRGPLVRLGAVRCDAADWLLVLTVHHIIADGWSIDIIWRDLSRAYERHVHRHPGPPFAEPAPRLRDWVRGEQQAIDTGAAAADLEYWRRALNGLPPVRIQPDFSPAGGGPAGRVPARIRTQRFRIGSDVAAALRRSVARFRATAHMIALSALMIVLAERLRRPRVAVLTLLNRRDSAGVGELVGCLRDECVVAATLPIDGRPDSAVRPVRDAVVGAWEHHRASTRYVWRALGFAARSVDVWFYFDEGTSSGEVIFGGVPANPYAVGQEGDAELAGPGAPGVTLHIGLFDGRLSGAIRYDASRYASGTMVEFAEEYVECLRALVAR